MVGVVLTLVGVSQMTIIKATFTADDGVEVCNWEFDLESFMMATERDKDQIWKLIREQFEAYIRQQETV